MSTATRRVWTRPDLEKAARGDVPEGQTESAIYVRISPLALLYLMDFIEAKGPVAPRIELVSAHGDTNHVELRFFRRDV